MRLLAAALPNVVMARASRSSAEIWRDRNTQNHVSNFVFNNMSADGLALLVARLSVGIMNSKFASLLKWLVNRPISRIPQCPCPISHSSEWCTVGCMTDALYDLWIWPIEAMTNTTYPDWGLFFTNIICLMLCYGSIITRHGFVRRVVIHPCLNFSGCLNRPPLSWHGWVITTPWFRINVIIYVLNSVQV